MRGRPRRRSLVTKVLRPPFTEDGKIDHLVCYLWGGKIKPPGYTGIVGTLGDWENARDSVLCERIREQTDFGVHSPDSPYYSSWEWSDKEGRIIPTDFAKRFYDLAKKRGYKWIHLLGYSGGAAVLSSALAHHSDKKDANMVKSLIIINGQIAERTGKYSCIPYTDAGYYAETIKASTLLIYGDDDPCRNDLEEWDKRNKAKVPPFYHGGHDFGREGQVSFELVAKTVIDWLKNSPDQGVRLLRLRGRRRRRNVGRRAKTVRHA
jgi:hypothetical protein